MEGVVLNYSCKYMLLRLRWIELTFVGVAEMLDADERIEEMIGLMGVR